MSPVVLRAYPFPRTGGSDPRGSISRILIRAAANAERPTPQRGPTILAVHYPPNARRLRWNEPSTTRHVNDSPERFRVTHPFHPYCSREFKIAAWRRNWTEDRVYYTDGSRRLRSVPTGWTNLIVEDPIVCLSAGRSHFKALDLLELAALM